MAESTEHKREHTCKNFFRSLSWQGLANQIADDCLPNEQGQVSVVEFVALHFDITMTAAGLLWIEFMKSHPAAADEYSQIPPDVATMIPTRAACLLAYLDSVLQPIMTPGWKIWDTVTTEAVTEVAAEIKESVTPAVRKRKLERVAKSSKRVRSILRPEKKTVHSERAKRNEARSVRATSQEEKKPHSQPKFLFRTGLTDTIKHPELELCAVCHKYGKFTLIWMKPPTDSARPEDLRKSAASIEWEEAQADLETGLSQLDGGGRKGWGKEHTAFVDFLTRSFYFDTKGFIIKKQKDIQCPEYENTLIFAS